MYKTLIGSVMLAVVVAACGRGVTPGASHADAGFQVRNGDLPTVNEAAAIYPGLAGGDHLLMNIDAVARPASRIPCDRYWTVTLAVTSGRGVHYNPKGSGEDIAITMAAFADTKAAATALRAIKDQIRACLGSRTGADGQREQWKGMNLPDGFAGYDETSHYDKNYRAREVPRPFDIHAVHIFSQRQGFVTSVDIMAPTGGAIDQAKALRLAKLARSIVGRAPDAHEPVPAGTKLHDYSRKAREVRDMSDALRHDEWPLAFRKFVGELADSRLPNADQCDPVIEVYKYRSDGYAHLGVTNCFAPAARGYYAISRGKEWKVIAEGDFPGPGVPLIADCKVLAAAKFPSQIAGTWCVNGPSGQEHEYPLQ